MSAELQKNVILGNFARENLNPTGERKLRLPICPASGPRDDVIF